jgi:hypothetical protein
MGDGKVQLYRMVFSSRTGISADDVYEVVRVEGDRALKHAPGRADDGVLVAERDNDGTWVNVVSGMKGTLTPL